MATSLILTIMGEDRPGIVDILAKTITDNNGNWLDSSISHLANQFAGVMIVEVPPENTEALITAFNELESEGLQVTVAKSEDVKESFATKSFTLELVGHDQPGIIRDIFHVLSKHQVNVEQLDTKLVSGSMSAEALFKAQAKLSAAEHLDLASLQDSLETIANDLMVDIEFD